MNEHDRLLRLTTLFARYNTAIGQYLRSNTPTPIDVIMSIVNNALNNYSDHPHKTTFEALRDELEAGAIPIESLTR